MKKFLYSLLFVTASVTFIGWGWVGHKIISFNSKNSFPAEMEPLFYWQTILADHASDADNRKSSDKTESIKHYIDIDNYKQFVNEGRITEDFDSLVADVGISFIEDQGTLPWSIIRTYDSLKTLLSNRKFSEAALIAADLGHYVADAHMPLHITRNYNGQYSGQYGVHSRYESKMISKYQSQISYSPRQAVFVDDVSDFTFAMIYESYQFVDSVLFADKQSSQLTGSNSSDAYLEKMWEFTGNYTDSLFARASFRLASLIYTAWSEAGKPDPAVTTGSVFNNKLAPFELMQNYPNPFNPATTISYNVSGTENGIPQQIKLTVFNSLGEQIAELVNEPKSGGIYSIEFNPNNLSSGVYYYSLSAGEYRDIKKMLLLR